LRKQLVSGFFWMLTGSGVQSVMQFIVLIVLSRLLDPEAFGIASAALIVITFTVVFSTLGFGPSLIQKKYIHQKHISTAFTTAIIFAIIFSIIIFASSSIVSVFFQMPELSTILKVMSVVFIIEGLTKVSESLIQRNFLFNLLVRIQVVSYLIYGIAGTILAIYGAGVWSLVFAQIAQKLTKSFLSLYLQPYKFRLSFDLNAFKELFYFSGGYSIAKISSEFSNQGDNFIIGKFLGADALGLYSRAFQLMVAPVNLMGKVLEKVLFPVMSQIQDNNKKLNYLFVEGIRIASTTMLPISIFLLINAENIILLLFGEKWLDLIVPFQILAISLPFRSNNKLSDSLSKSKGAVYYRALVKWTYAFLVIVMSFIGHFYGLAGTAIGVTLANILNYVLMTLLAVKLTRVSYKRIIQCHLGGFFITIILLIVLFPFVYYINPLINNVVVELILSIICFITISFSCIVLASNLTLGPEGAMLIQKFKDGIKHKLNLKNKYI